MEREQGGGGFVARRLDLHFALPQQRAALVFELGHVIGPGLALRHGVGADLRNQPFRHAEQLDGDAVDIDGNDRHAGGVFARQDQPVAERQKRRPVAQGDLDLLGREQFEAVRRRQSGPHFGLIGNAERHSRETQALAVHPHRRTQLGHENQVFVIMRGGIERPGKYQARLGGGLCGVDIETLEAEFRRHGRRFGRRPGGGWSRWRGWRRWRRYRGRGRRGRPGGGDWRGLPRAQRQADNHSDHDGEHRDAGQNPVHFSVSPSIRAATISAVAGRCKAAPMLRSKMEHGVGARVPPPRK